MKKLNYISLISFVSLIFPLAVTFSMSNGATSSLKELISACGSKNYKKASQLVAYNLNDQSRVFKDSYTSDDPKELKQVKRICKKIKALLDISSTHEIGEEKKTIEQKINVTKIEVAFTSGTQKLKTVFTFIDVDGKYLLKDVK